MAQSLLNQTLSAQVVAEPNRPWTTFEAAVQILAGALGVGASGTVTPHFVTMGASASQDIPISAKGWSFTVLTGTGTIGGQTLIAGQTVSSANTLAAAVTVTTDSASSGFASWEI